MPALDHREHAALGHGTRFTSSQTAWARFRLVMVVSIVKGPETTHALASAETSRHDDHGADNAEYRRVRPPPEERLSLLGVRGYKNGKPARITPRDLCRVVNPRRQPAAGNGLTSHCIGTHRMTSSYLN